MERLEHGASCGAMKCWRGKRDCITHLNPTESGATTEEAAVMAVKEQAPVSFERKKYKDTVFIGSSKTKKGNPHWEVSQLWQ